MTRKKLTAAEEKRLWHQLQQRLAMLDREPPVTTERATDLWMALPTRGSHESLGDWLRRVQQPSLQPYSDNIIPFKAKPRWRFTPLAEIRRLAADSGGVEIPLPDPGRALETADGRFRLMISAEKGMIQLGIEALGFAADTFANQRLSIAGPGGEEELIAIIELDADGDGGCQLKDCIEVRRALLNPIIGLIEDA